MATASDISIASPPRRGRTARLVVFRVLMALIALVHLVLFAGWQSILAPWVTFADAADHGWARTPELHRLADGAAGAIFVAIAAAAVVLAIRPARTSGLAAWLAAALGVTGAFSWLSALVQGHDDIVSMLVFSLVWVALVAAIFVWLHPEGRDILRGGSPDAHGRPGRALQVSLIAIGVAGATVAVAAVAWRVAGGVFESPLEDDVFSLVYFGALWGLGGLIAARGRAGFRPLAVIVLTGAAYSIAAGLTVALT